jgi:hypothetical protein
LAYSNNNARALHVFTGLAERAGDVAQAVLYAATAQRLLIRAKALQCVGRELTPAVKARLTPGDLARVRRTFTVRLAELQPANPAQAKAG